MPEAYGPDEIMALIMLCEQRGTEVTRLEEKIERLRRQNVELMSEASELKRDLERALAS